MDAALDTNVIINLYGAHLQDCIFERFDKIYVDSFVVNTEMKRHASEAILTDFEKDVQNGRVIVIRKEDLLQMGVFFMFEQHVRQERLIYEPGDLGEVYSIALAKTLGISVLVTDDIKEYGPHYSLIHEIDAEVMPFALYEILFLDFLEEKLSAEQYIRNFYAVTASATRPPSIRGRINKFDRRFWDEPLSEREYEWFVDWCQQRNIDYNKKYDDIFDALDRQ